ncbi:MAG TPA: RAMP superfamily CRISPR-associated protein [Thermoanaerobaculia bacterium]|nr:RAMP superfamily CRISPR-associated protein [Thermoanaerobaculia bacterium]
MPRLEITVHGHLLVAGNQDLALGVDLTTARRFHEGQLMPYIPATALRGAVRLQLEALLAGAGEPDVDPYPLDREKPLENLDSPVARLFGYSGKLGERTNAREGCLRFGDALPSDPERAVRALSVRPGLEIDDYSATAEDKKLFFREVAETSSEPLVFEAELEISRDVQEEDRKYLQAAVETTDALGAGKSKGGGSVAIRWIDDAAAPSASQVRGDPDTATRARLVFTLREPAHFGDGGPQGNHHATRTYVPGATVCGAVAWSLIRSGVDPERDPAFQSLFVGEEAASFGDALFVPDPEAEPRIMPATRRKRRGTGERRDILLNELARDRVNRLLEDTGCHWRADDGPARFDPDKVRPGGQLVRRIRTRLSIDRYSGASAHGKLFSIEQIEPWIPGKKETPHPVRFSAWVEGLDAAGARLLARAAEQPVLLGAGRNHGLGKADLEIDFAGEPDPAEAERQILALADRLDRETRELAARAGLSTPPDSDGRVPLALVALSDFVPSDRRQPHPLAETAVADGDGEPQLTRSFLLPQGAAGGYDQRRKEGALKDLQPAVGAGSVFVYEMPREGLDDRLRRLLPRLRHGVGGSTESGCGRFGIFELIEKE